MSLFISNKNNRKLIKNVNFSMSFYETITK